MILDRQQFDQLAAHLEITDTALLAEALLQSRKSVHRQLLQRFYGTQNELYETLFEMQKEETSKVITPSKCKSGTVLLR